KESLQGGFGLVLQHDVCSMNCGRAPVQFMTFVLLPANPHLAMDQTPSLTRMLDRALEARTHYVRLADRAAKLYSAFVHAAALATMLGWVAFGASWHDAIITAIAVLIITCPCALGLAIPAVQVWRQVRCFGPACC